MKRKIISIILASALAAGSFIMPASGMFSEESLSAESESSEVILPDGGEESQEDRTESSLLPEEALITEAASEEEQLLIQDIPAEDISEQELPLAAGPNTEATDAARHAAMMGVVLLATIGYAVYFGRYDKRLADLRLEAAKAETAAMRRRKTDTAVNRRGDREEL